MMRSRAVAAVVCSGSLLAGCAERAHVDTVTWQITDVYVSSDTPSGVPDDIAGKAVLVFGRSTLAGNTGCAPLHGKVSYDGASPQDATSLTISSLRVDDPSPECSGQAMYVHQELVSMLEGGFDFRHEDHELVLQKQPSGLDSPAIRLVY